MAVPQQQPFVEYAANGVVTAFAIPFKLLRGSDLAVILNGTQVTGGYAFTGLGNNTSTIIFDVAPTGVLLLQREIPLERETDYQTNGDLLAQTINLDFDRLWMAVQDMVRRALSRPLFSNYYDAGNRLIKNLGDGGDDRDAVNNRVMRAYVDSAVAGVVGGFGNFIQAGAGAIQRTFQNKMRDIVSRADFSTTADFNAAKGGKFSIDGSNRARATSFIAGEEELSGAATRDAYVAGRTVLGATDCHAFADRTVLDEITDAGTYGSFDCTVTLNGSNVQNHVYTYQDRVTYAGSGTLQNSTGFYSRMKHTGTGNIDKRYGVDIGDVEVTAGGTVTEQIGVYIRDQTRGSAKVGLNIAQTTGYAIYAPGVARSYLRGALRIGVDDASSVPFSVGTTGAPNFYVLPTAGNMQIGATGDSVFQILTNSAVRLEVSTSANGYGLRPGADNTQPLGATNRRWSQLFAGTATISTSDAREKTEVRKLTDGEIAAARDLAREIGAFRFLSAVEQKGGDAREHIGMTVQRAIEVMESHGLRPFSYSFICYDKWEDGDLYSFRFDGLLAFIAAGFEARLAALESAA